MARRRSSNPGDLSVVLILGGLGALAYFIYKSIPSVSAAVTKGAQDTANQLLYGAAFNPTDVVPGTGQTVAELQARGITNAQIGQMYQQDTQNWLINNGAVDMSIPTF